MKRPLGNMQDSNKKSNIDVIRVPEGEENVVLKYIYKEIMIEKFSSLEKHTPQVLKKYKPTDSRS